MMNGLLALISIFLPYVMRGATGPIVRPGPGTYPVGTPVTIVLDDVHMCAGMRIEVDGLEAGEFTSGGNCDSGAGVAELVVLVPATVTHITVTPLWFNGDPCETAEVATWFEFEEAK